MNNSRKMRHFVLTVAESQLNHGTFKKCDRNVWFFLNVKKLSSEGLKKTILLILIIH